MHLRRSVLSFIVEHSFVYDLIALPHYAYHGSDIEFIDVIARRWTTHRDVGQRMKNIVKTSIMTGDFFLTQTVVYNLGLLAVRIII